MFKFDKKSEQHILHLEKNKSQQQMRGGSQYAAMRQMSSLVGNQAMLAMMRSSGQSQDNGTPFTSQMRERFGLPQRPAEQSKSPKQTSTGGTSLPDYLREKFEQKSGLPMDDVRVHYNSDQPEQLDALAYTYGTDVYIGPGQEDHLEHELGHVVQQKQGVVRPTSKIKGLPLNSMPELETAAELGTMPTSISGTAQSHAVIQRCGGNANLSKCPYCEKKGKPRSEGYLADGPCAAQAMGRLFWKYPYAIQASMDFWDSRHATEVKSDFSNIRDIEEPILVLVRSPHTTFKDRPSHVFCAQRGADGFVIYSSNDQSFASTFNMENITKSKRCTHWSGERLSLKKAEGGSSSIPEGYQLKYFTKAAYEAAVSDMERNKAAEWDGINFEKDDNSSTCCTIV